MTLTHLHFGLGLAGFLFSTVLIVIFGEIVPQAVCTKHALGLSSYNAKP